MKRASVKKSIWLWATLAATAPILCASEPDFRETFEEAFAGEPFRSEQWTRAGFPPPAWQQGFDDGRVFVDDCCPRNGSSQSIRVEYPKGGVGPQQTGAQVPLKLPPREEYFVSYWLRFGDGFSWGSRHQGGKLPGLASGDLCSGGQSCDGNNGFTARLMWRTGGKAVLYLYHMDKPGKYGEDHSLVYPSGEDVVFTPGRWFQIVERVKVNTGDNRDGEVQLWVDGQPVLSLNGIRFVNNGDLVDRFFFSTFHGGADSEWAPQVDSHINFDDLVVGASYEAVAGE